MGEIMTWEFKNLKNTIFPYEDNRARVTKTTDNPNNSMKKKLQE